MMGFHICRRVTQVGGIIDAPYYYGYEVRVGHRAVVVGTRAPSPGAEKTIGSKR